MPDFPIFICRKCCHILDLACDFRNMCIKSNRLLRGYVTQLKSASNSVDNIRNELFTMFNNDHKHITQEPLKINQQLPHLLPQHKQDPGPSNNNKLPVSPVLYPRPIITNNELREREDLRQNIIKVKQETAEELSYAIRSLQHKNNLIPLTSNNKHHEKLVVQVDNSVNVMSCFDIKSEFVNELATNPVVDTIINAATTDTFNFELKPSGPQCSLCHKCFSRESVLTRHMLTHSGERPHHCTVCNKNFTHKFNLKQHMLIHSGHKTHHCTVCDKGFIKKSDLDRHMLTHFGERIHHCSLCNKSFVRKENLNQHILTHTGQKPHHCSQCTKSFLRKSDLNRHTVLCISKRS